MQTGVHEPNGSHMYILTHIHMESVAAPFLHQMQLATAHQSLTSQIEACSWDLARKMRRDSDAIRPQHIH